MTSRNSFYRLRAENIKHRIGMIFLVSFCFFAYMIWYLISVQNICNGLDGVNIKESIAGLSEPVMSFGMVVILAAVLLSVSGFRYLHSRTEIDFYHSLPVKRRIFLYLTATNDLLLFAALLIVLSIYKCVVTAVVGYFTPEIGINLVWAVVCYLLLFEVSYLVMTLVMILTGHTFVGILGFMVFAVYAPFMLRYLYPELASLFFKTYTAAVSSWGAVFDYFSPVTLAVRLLADGDSWMWKNHIPALVIICAWVLVLAFLDFLLFEKRASEMAGRAMAFPKTAPVIRILFVIPASIYVGLYLHAASFASFKFWLVAGIVIGGFLVHGIMECIYQFDVHGLLSHKKQMAASIVLALAIVGFFQADIPGYDAYLPDKEETEAVLIENRYVYDLYSGGKEKSGVSGETMEKVLETLADVVAENDKNSEDYFSPESASSDYRPYTVTYRLKNGKEKKRFYILSREKEERLLGQIFGTQEYKEDEYALYTADWSKVVNVTVDDFKGSEELKLNEEKKTELFRIYLEELSELTYDTVRTTLPFGRLVVYHNASAEAVQSNSFSIYSYDTYVSGSRDVYYLYPTFVKTIQYLEDECELELQTSMEDVQITRLSVVEYNDEERADKEYSVSDEEFIRSIKSKLINSELLEEREYYYPLDFSVLDITATVIFEDGPRELTMYTDTDTVKKIQEYLKMK